MKIYFIAAMALVLAACGKQDPLADQPDYIRKATPGFNKPAPPVASKENMIISANASHFFFTENVEGQTTITGRILIDNYESSLEIDNLADFEGATFDADTGLFSWTPKKGFVTGTGSSRTTFLRVRLNGVQTKTNITATRSEDFPVTVSRLESQPTIVRETGFPNGAAREGDNLRLTIFVKDLDATNIAGGKPRIFIQSPTNEPRVGDLTPYLRVASEDDPEQDFSDPTLWKFTVNVALTDADVTKNTGDFYFRVTAVSRFGKMSPTKEYKVTVLTNLEQPLVSADSFQTTAGTTMGHDVLVLDARQEGRVSVEIQNAYDFPVGFSFSCEAPLTTAWLVKCHAKWETPAAPAALPAPVTVRIRTINRSPVSFDNYTAEKTYNLKYQVVAP